MKDVQFGDYLNIVKLLRKNDIFYTGLVRKLDNSKSYRRLFCFYFKIS